MASVGSPPNALRGRDSSRGAAGRYAFVAEIARGYLGTLWVARDPADASGRSTAFVRHVTPVTAVSTKTALLEAARSAIIAGADTLEVHEGKTGVDVVTPFEDGEILRSLLRTSALRHAQPPTPVLLGIAAQLADCVHTMHGAAESAVAVFGGVHPDSVFVGSDGTVHLMDAGAGALASAREPWRSDPQRIGYFAPEQLETHGGVDARTDVFALGIILWEAFANRRLFPGNDAKSARERVLKSPIPRLDATRQSASSGTPTEIAGLIAQALARSSADRFHSMEALASALRGLGAADEAPIGEWVRSLAGQVIEKRRQMLERVGSGQYTAVRAPTLGERPSVVPHSPSLHDGGVADRMTPAVPMSRPAVARAFSASDPPPPPELDTSDAGITTAATPKAPAAMAPAAMAPAAMAPAAMAPAAMAPAAMASAAMASAAMASAEEHVAHDNVAYATETPSVPDSAGEPPTARIVADASPTEPLADDPTDQNVLASPEPTHPPLSDDDAIRRDLLSAPEPTDPPPSDEDATRRDAPSGPESTEPVVVSHPELNHVVPDAHESADAPVAARARADSAESIDVSDDDMAPSAPRVVAPPPPSLKRPPKLPDATPLPGGHAEEAVFSAESPALSGPVRVSELATLTSKPAGSRWPGLIAALVALLLGLGVAALFVGRSRKAPVEERHASAAPGGATANAPAHDVPEAPTTKPTQEGVDTKDNGTRAPIPSAVEATPKSVAVPEQDVSPSPTVPAKTGDVPPAAKPVEAPKVEAAKLDAPEPATAAKSANKPGSDSNATAAVKPRSTPAESGTHRPTPSRTAPGSTYKPGGI